MKQRYWRRGLAAAALVCALLATAWPAGATNLRFAHPAFQALWARTDQFRLDVSYLNGLGWRARYNSAEAVAMAIRAALEQSDE